MAALDADLVLDLLTLVTTGDNRATLESTPALAWLLPDLESQRDHLTALLAAQPDADDLAATREATRRADATFDDDARHLYYLLHAGRFVPDAATRTAVASAQAVLFPEGLRVITGSFRGEAAFAHAFAARLERPDVKAAFQAATYAPDLVAAAQRVVTAAQSLNDALAAVEKAEAQAQAAPSAQTLYEARRDALRTWRQLVSTAEYALAGEDPDTVSKREALLSRWRRAIAEHRADPVPPALPEAAPADGDTAG